MNIRIAHKDDIPKLKELDVKDQYFVEHLGEYHTVLDDDEFLNHFLESDSIFVAEEFSKVYGFLLAQIKEWMFHYKKIIWIEHIVVDPDKRREGIAQNMIKFMMDHYKTKDPEVRFVYSIINPDNKASLKMSRKFEPLSKSVFMILKEI